MVLYLKTQHYWSCISRPSKNGLLSQDPGLYSTDRSKAVVSVLVLLFVALWFILRCDLFMSCLVLFCSCVFSVLLHCDYLAVYYCVVLVLFVSLFDLRLFGFVCFLFLCEGLRFVIMALPGLFSYLFCISRPSMTFE